MSIKPVLHLAPTCVATSAGLMLVSLFVGGSERIDVVLYRIGLAVVILSSTAWVLAKSHVSEDMVERARQQGWDDGYENGLTDARPTNVVLLERTSLRLPLAPDGPPQEFAQ